MDLAAVAWAECLSNGGQVVFQTSSWYHRSEDAAVEQLTHRYGCPDEPTPDVMVVEDQPHAVRWDHTTKAVARFQGRIIERMKAVGCADRMLFLPPSVWQHSFEGVWRNGATGALLAARKYGYEPPDLLALHGDELPRGKERAKSRNLLRKLSSDYVDAFLIARWATDYYAAHGTFDAPSTQRYLR